MIRDFCTITIVSNAMSVFHVVPSTVSCIDEVERGTNDTRQDPVQALACRSAQSSQICTATMVQLYRY